jgi:hypothetical protein
MSRFLVTALGTAVVLGAMASPVLAGQPDPNQSTFDALIGASPKNQTVTAGNEFIYDGILRDGAGVPIGDFPAAQVELDFTSCTNPSTRPSDQIGADTDSDTNTGRVFWDLGLTFGGADPCEVRVLVQNVVFEALDGGGSVPCAQIDGGLRSPDEDGGGTITLGDFTTWRAEFNNPGPNCNDWRGDLDLNGATTLSDLTRFRAHFNAP